MWTIEAFRADGDELAWDLDLTDVERSTLEEHLGLDTLDIPGVLPLTVDQVRSLLTEIMHLDPGEHLAQADQLEFFLAEYDEEQ